MQSDGFTGVLCYDGMIASESGCMGTAVAQKWGVLTSTWSPASRTSYATDGLQRITGSEQVTDGTAYPFSYSYNVDGTVRTEQYPSGRVVAYDYDRRGLARKVGLNQVGNADYGTASYAPHGGLGTLTLGNGATETWSYNNRLQVERIEAVWLGASQWKLENCYRSDCMPGPGNSGNVMLQKLTRPRTAGGSLQTTTSYGYDNVNRLTSAQETGVQNGWWSNYSYLTQHGNPTATGNGEIPVGLTCGSYDVNTNRCNGVGYSYDSAGNLITYQGRGASYDAANRQTQLVDGATWQYSSVRSTPVTRQ